VAESVSIFNRWLHNDSIRQDDRIKLLSGVSVDKCNQLKARWFYTPIRVFGPIEAFLSRQKYEGRNSSEILKGFRRFYRDTSLSDYANARMIGVDPLPIPAWIKGIHRPQLANLRKIDRFMEKYGPEYL
jgi:hypothetical protein